MKKISLINGVDPFGKVSEGVHYPPVDDNDLLSYLVASLVWVSLRPGKD